MDADRAEFLTGAHTAVAAGWRKVMMWWFIVTDGLLFAGFIASYGYARVLAFHWPAQSEVFSLKYIAAMYRRLNTDAWSGQRPAMSRAYPYEARNPANSRPSVTMNHHIITFRHPATAGYVALPQTA